MSATHQPDDVLSDNEPTGCMLFHSLIPCDFVNDHLWFLGSENPTGLNIEIQSTQPP